VPATLQNRSAVFFLFLSICFSYRWMFNISFCCNWSIIACEWVMDYRGWLHIEKLEPYFNWARFAVTLFSLENEVAGNQIHF
jgi:hypothetical protein